MSDKLDTSLEEHDPAALRMSMASSVTAKKSSPIRLWIPGQVRSGAGIAQGSDLSDPEVLDVLKYIENLERGNPISLCSCGFPHLDYECVKDDHDKKHCQRCCDTPRNQLHCVL